MDIKKILVGAVCFVVLVAIIVEWKDLIALKNSHKNIENLLKNGIKVVLRVIKK